MSDALIVRLKRVRSGPDGTFGELYVGGKQVCVTCEDPWNDNKPGVSCIPAGGYWVGPHTGSRFKNVWEVLDVPGRSAILIHNGNTIRDTQGCILVGAQFGELNGLPAVLYSIGTLVNLRKALPGRFWLEIEDVTDIDVGRKTAPQPDEVTA